jgi:formylglycine-generating enzyme required for sulfatase activity
MNKWRIVAGMGLISILALAALHSQVLASMVAAPPPMRDVVGTGFALEQRATAALRAGVLPTATPTVDLGAVQRALDTVVAATRTAQSRQPPTATPASRPDLRATQSALDAAIATAVAASLTARSRPCANDAALVADLTIPNDSIFQPGDRFAKTWRVLNSGQCQWGWNYRLVFVGGDRMGAPYGQALAPTAPGQTADVTVPMVAPFAPGVYNSIWQLADDRGETFGDKLIVTIQVRPRGNVSPQAVRPTDGMMILYVPPGQFQMGSTEPELDYAVQLAQPYLRLLAGADRTLFQKQEQPLHTVVLSAFWIDRTEVTNAQYRRCVQADSCTPPSYWADERLNDDAQPVVGVSWNDAGDYCRWVGARLPTEAEWEYAARGPQRRIFPWGDDFDAQRVNYCDASCEKDWADRRRSDGYARTAPVGSFANGVSWSGALDMAGNAWEWVADGYGTYRAETQIDPTGPEDRAKRVLRGGSWDNPPFDVRSAVRGRAEPGERQPNYGFRCTSPGG